MKRIVVFIVVCMLCMTSLSVMGQATSYYENDTIAIRLYYDTQETTPTEDIIITNAVKQLYVGDTFRYVLLIKEDEPEWYRWKTSDSSIATINERTGELTAKKAGKVVVTVTSKRKGKTASYTLQILDGTRKNEAEQKKENSDTLFIKEGTKEVMASDFNNWKQLTYVVIPESVEKLYQKNYDVSKTGERTPLKDTTTGGAFRGDSKIEAYYVDGNNRNFFSVNGVLYRGDLQKDLVRIPDNITADKTLYRYPVAKKDTVFVIPEFVSGVDEYAFAGAKNLKEVSTHSLTSLDKKRIEVGAYAFYGCTNLKLLRLNSLESATTKEELYEVIGNFNKENYQDNGQTPFEKIQKTKLPFVSSGMKKNVYFYTPWKKFQAARLVKQVYGLDYRTEKESTTDKSQLQMEYPNESTKEIGIGDSLYGEPYRLVAQGFHKNATYSYTVKDDRILSVKTKGAYGYLTGKKVGSTTVTCKQTYKGKTTTIGTIKITVKQLINKEALQADKPWETGTYQKMLIPYPTTGATYTFKVNKSGLVIKENSKLDMEMTVGATQSVTATKAGTYQVSIQETYKSKTKTIGTYTITVANNPNHYETKKEVNYALGQRIEAYDLVNDCEEPITFYLKYDTQSFIPYKKGSTKTNDLIPIKEGSSIVEVYEDSGYKKKLGEVMVHIQRKELTTFKAKVDEIAMYVGQTLEWDGSSESLRDKLEIKPSYVGECEYALFDLATDNKEMLSFQRNGNSGMDMTALKVGTTNVTITANSKQVKLKVLVFQTEEECYEYMDSKK